MIRIYKETETLIQNKAWDFGIDELDYLLEERPGEAFVLLEDRLWEAEEPM